MFPPDPLGHGFLYIQLLLGVITLFLQAWGFMDAVVDIHALERDTPTEPRCIIAKRNQRDEAMLALVECVLLVIGVAVLLVPDSGKQAVDSLLNGWLPFLLFLVQVLLCVKTVLDRTDRQRLMDVATIPTNQEGA